MTVYAYKVMVQDVLNRSLAMLDASLQYEDTGSDVKEAARDRAVEYHVHFQFPQDAPNVPDIREGAELWAGWQADGVWMPGEVAMGFIMQSEGSMIGSTHHIHTTVVGPNVLFSRCSVKGWPTGGGASGIPTGGIGAGYSVAAWLTANGSLTNGASGVVRTKLPGCDYSGVDPSFTSRIFTAQTRPGNADPDYPFIGCWSFTTLEKVLQDIAGAVRTVWPAVKPVYWLEAATDGSSIFPRFVFRDDADTSGPIRGRFSTNPAAGEFRIG